MKKSRLDKTNTLQCFNIISLFVIFSFLSSPVSARRFSEKDKLDQVVQLTKENIELNKTIADQVNTIKMMNITLQTYIKVLKY
jgi:hypothetical protein